MAGKFIAPCLQDRVEQDSVLQFLTKDANIYTHTILSDIFKQWVQLLKRLVSDHIGEGKYASMDDILRTDTKSVVKHNKLAHIVYSKKKTHFGMA
jgi:hypothetical protein